FAIVKSSGRDPGAVAPLVALAEALAMPVFDQAATHLNFPQDHPLYGGGDPTAYLSDADPIVVVEADAPWFPALRAPRPETTVIQIGHDPLFSRYPIRGFAVDLGLAGAPRLTLAALAAAVQRRGGDATTLEARRRRLHLRHPDGRPLDGAGAQPPRADHRLQQPRVERGEALGGLARPAGLGRADRVHADERAGPGAGLRGHRPGVRQLGRARRGGGEAAGHDPPGAADRPRGQASRAPERDLQEADAVTARRVPVIATGPSRPSRGRDPRRRA